MLTFHIVSILLIGGYGLVSNAERTRARLIKSFNPTYWWIWFSILEAMAEAKTDLVSILLIGGYGLVLDVTKISNLQEKVSILLIGGYGLVLK